MAGWQEVIDREPHHHDLEGKAQEGITGSSAGDEYNGDVSNTVEVPIFSKMIPTQVVTPPHLINIRQRNLPTQPIMVIGKLGWITRLERHASVWWKVPTQWTR